MDPEAGVACQARPRAQPGLMQETSNLEARVTTGVDPGEPAAVAGSDADEHFQPKGTIFILAMFVAALILLWGSVYVILLSRGVTL